MPIQRSKPPHFLWTSYLCRLFEDASVLMKRGEVLALRAATLGFLLWAIYQLARVHQ